MIVAVTRITLKEPFHLGGRGEVHWSRGEGKAKSPVWSGMDRSCHMVGVRSGYFSSIGGSPDDSIRG